MLGLVLLVVLSSSLPTSARSAPRRTAIALVQGGAGPELGARLRAELEALGWRVLAFDAQGEVALAQIARRAATLAVVRVGQRAEGIEVWVAPEVDAQARSEWIDVDRARPDLAVVLAVESLRARFVELGIEPEGTSAPQPPIDEPAPPAATRAAASRPQLWLGAFSALSQAPGGVGTSPYLGVNLRLVPLPALGFGVEVWWPPSASSVSDSEGTAEVRALLAAATAEYRLEQGAWTGAVGFGAALAALDLRGRGSPGYVGRSDRIFTALPMARAAAELTALPRLRLRLEAGAGVSVPRAVVQFGEREAASWGRPLLLVGLGAEWAVLGGS